MITFNEGTPGAGKTYDAVKTHLLAALAKRRKVYARINGLNHARIAAHLGMTEEECRQLLHVLDDNEVRTLYDVATQDALIIVDEAHMYWVAARDALSPEWEKFFAEHRHQGQDILLISQWYKRLHSAVRARVESKAVFTKHQALGFKGAYCRRFYTALEPDKFELVASENKRYDKEIFALYQSVVQGTENLETYDGGRKTVWAKIALPAMIVIPAAIFGIGYLIAFFTGGVDLTDKPEPAHLAADAPAPQAGFKPGDAPAAVPQFVAPKKPPRPAGVEYIFKLSEDARPRVAGIFEGTKKTAIIEWRVEQGHVSERLTTQQLAELGMRTQFTRYGVKLSYKGETIIATMHPTGDDFGRVSQARIATIGNPTAGAPASFASSRTSGLLAARTTGTATASKPRVGEGFAGVEAAMGTQP